MQIRCKSVLIATDRCKQLHRGMKWVYIEIGRDRNWKRNSLIRVNCLLKCIRPAKMFSYEMYKSKEMQEET